MTSSAICDWLDVTTPPDSLIPDTVISFATGVAADLKKVGSNDSSFVFRIGDGVLKVDKNSRHCRVSASGGVLAYMRSAKIFNDYLSLLSDGPHRVTRVDAAVDVPEDGADSIARLKRRYRKEGVKLTRKALPVSLMTAYRDSDNRETGTFYAGHRTRAQVTARVYDKAHEVSCKTGFLVTSPLTRYELTVRGDHGPSLRDAAEPCRIFWHFMSPALIRKPKGLEIPPWESGWGGSWESEIVDILPAVRLKNLIGNNDIFDRMLLLAEEIGPEGKTYLHRQLKKRLGLT